MKTKNLLALALLTAGLALSSQAQIVGDTGDLILGFRQAGNANDLVVDLGQASTFRNLAAGSTISLGQLSVADISTVFGGTWNTANNIKWGVFGSTVDGEGGAMGGIVADNTVWATSLSPTVLQRAPVVALSTASSQIYNLYGSILGATSNVSSSQALKIGSGTGSNGYTENILAGGATLSFAYFNTAVENNTLGTKTLELYELQPGSGPGKDLGYFTLDGTGLTFTAFQAIPEPSTYAALLGVATLGFVAIRRRKQVQFLA